MCVVAELIQDLHALGHGVAPGGAAPVALDLEELVLLGKQARVSDVARSHDMEILKAMIAGEKPETIDALEAAVSDARS